MRYRLQEEVTYEFLTIPDLDHKAIVKDKMANKFASYILEHYEPGEEERPYTVMYELDLEVMTREECLQLLRRIDYLERENEILKWKTNC